MKLQPTTGPKTAHTAFEPWWSLAARSALTAAPQTSAARATARMRGAVMSPILAARAPSGKPTAGSALERRDRSLDDRLAAAPRLTPRHALRGERRQAQPHRGEDLDRLQDDPIGQRAAARHAEAG